MGAIGGDLPSMRQMYRAGKGKVLVGADFSQLELRVMSAVSGDQKLESNLKTGDVYTEDAKDWFQLPAHFKKADVKKPVRQAAKIIHLGAQYAAGTGTIFVQALEQDQTFKWSACVLLHNAFKRTYAGTVAYWAEEEKRVLHDGYSESRILKRRRVYPRPPAITEIANYPVQATASDVANLAMIDIAPALKKIPGAAILIQLHDAFYVECYLKDRPVVQRILIDCMQQPHVINGRQWIFPADAEKSAENWGDM